MGTEFITKVEICGSRQFVCAIQELAHGDNPFDFDSIKPMPAAIMAQVDPDCPGMPKVVSDWRSQNWGCSYNSWNETTGRVFHGDNPGCISQLWYEIYSKNAPPIPLIQFLAETFPDVTIHMFTHDDLADWEIHRYYKNGKLEYEYETSGFTYSYAEVIGIKDNQDKCEDKFGRRIDRVVADPTCVAGLPTRFITKLIDDIETALRDGSISDQAFQSLKSAAIEALAKIRDDERSRKYDLNRFLDQYIHNKLLNYDSRYDDERALLVEVREAAKELYLAAQEVTDWNTNALPWSVVGRATGIFESSMKRLQEVSDYVRFQANNAIPSGFRTQEESTASE
jgi:hypothetical protein